MTENQLPIVHEHSAFANSASFEHAQRVAKMLSSSDLVPDNFKNNVANTMIALEMSNRISANPLMVMQNLYVVHGKPSWSSTFIIAAINTCKRFSPLRFEITGEGDNKGCTAWAKELSTGERIESPRVSIAMAKAEKWFSKKDRNGNETSKWQTMPDLMMRYRSAAFFGRLYAPEIMMGMHTADEMEDVGAVEVLKTKTKPVVVNKEAERVELMINDAATIEDLKIIEPHVQGDQLELFNARLAELQSE